MTTEPFPALDEGHDRLRPLNGEKRVQLQQRRRKSSGLGGEIRAGDTGVPAIATMAMRGQSPGILRVCWGVRCIARRDGTVLTDVGKERARSQGEAILET
jgi:hypothetical protein